MKRTLLYLFLTGTVFFAGACAPRGTQPVFRTESSAACPVNTLPGTIQGAIFDLDGTLVDSLYAWKTSSSDFLLSQGVTPPEGINEQMAQLSLLDGAVYLKEHFNLPQTPQEIVDLVVAQVGKKYETEIKLKPGVREFLAELKRRGVKMAVATASDRRPTEAVLRREGVLDLFEFILTCDEAGAGKRAPLVYRQTLARLGTPKEYTWVFEDAPYAVYTARRDGFLTAAVEDPSSVSAKEELRRRADRYVTSFSACTIDD